MLSINTKKGSSARDVAEVADYPDEHKDKEKAPGSIEDYYSQGSDKTPSLWLGGAAAELGLEGPVDREDHIKTLQALDPKTGEKLVSTSGEARRYGWDLTFSAPKSVSIAWAVGSEEVKKGIEAAQTRAVEKVFSHIEETFALARRGSSEKDTIVFEKAKLIAAAFLHGSSREQDPQLHTHLMLQNLLVREDGTFGTLEPKELFEWKMSLGALYRAELSKEIKEMGFGIEADGEYFRIAGIPKDLEEEFSKRRAQIEKSLEQSGFSGAKASEMAALDTRKGKEIIDHTVLEQTWEERAKAHGVTRESIEKLQTESQKNQVFVGLDDIFKKMTSMESIFQEKDLVKAVAVEMSHQGKGLDEVKEAVKELLADKDLVKLHGKDGKTYYTTKEIIKLEREILSNARKGKSDTSHVLSKEIIDQAISRRELEQGFKFSPEQTKAIHHLTETAGAIQIVQGHAGAGKSTALVPVRYAYESAGYEVIGCALQGKTAKLMQEETGIKATTIAKLLIDLEGFTKDDGSFSPPTRFLSEKSVIIVDEAMMMDTRTFSRLQTLAAKAGSKLELVGDVAQVPPVAAGHPVKAIMKEIPFVELTENRRQKTAWQNAASREIREGHIKEALVEYGKKDRITIAETRDEGMKLLIEKWSEVPDQSKTILTAYRNEDVGHLNVLAREKMQEKGLLTGIRAEVMTSTGKAEFQAGDRIFFSAGSKKSHHFDAGSVTNGQTGTLTKIEQNDKNIWCFHVRLDDGKTVIFDPKSYDTFKHGYAVTINKSQGATVEKSFNYVGLQGLEQFYVQMTRHKNDAHIVMTSDQIDAAADRLGIDLKPTEKMLKFAENVSKRHGIEVPAYCREDFDACRVFLNEKAYKIEQKEEEIPDFDLEKVSSLIKALEQSHEKMNALALEVEEQAEVVTQEIHHEEIHEAEPEFHYEEAPEEEQEAEKAPDPVRERVREREYEFEM
jgi:conjugative relaxase-like TrwC/TraI family protein